MEANKIIITGAATRMGAAIAKKLSGPGVEMVIHLMYSFQAGGPAVPTPFLEGLERLRQSDRRYSPTTP